MGLLYRALGLAVVLMSLSSGRSQWENSGATPRQRTAPLSAGQPAAARTGSKSRASAGIAQSTQLGPTSTTDKAPSAPSSGGHFDRLDSNKDGLLDRNEFKKIENLVPGNSLYVSTIAAAARPNDEYLVSYSFEMCLSVLSRRCLVVSMRCRRQWRASAELAAFGRQQATAWS